MWYVFYTENGEKKQARFPKREDAEAFIEAFSLKDAVIKFE